MRDFAFIPTTCEDPIAVPSDVEDQPLYQESVFDSVQFDQLEDGSFIQNDMTCVLLHQEKYRRLIGDMNVNDILSRMHPTQSTSMDEMTDEERFSCIISRHCQTLSERQAVLKQLADEKSELTKYAEALLAEQESEPDESPAPDADAQ